MVDIEFGVSNLKDFYSCELLMFHIWFDVDVLFLFSIKDNKVFYDWFDIDVYF